MLYYLCESIIRLNIYAGYKVQSPFTQTPGALAGNFTNKWNNDNVSRILDID